MIMMVRCSYPLIVCLDLLQYIHLHLYVLLTPLPYLYMQALSAFKNVNFLFLPALWTYESTDYTANYYDFQRDTTFLGNSHPLIFFLSIFGGTYLIFWLLSLQCNKIKWLRKKTKSIYRSRMRFSFIH